MAILTAMKVIGDSVRQWKNWAGRVRPAFGKLTLQTAPPALVQRRRNDPSGRCVMGCPTSPALCQLGGGI